MINYMFIYYIKLVLYVECKCIFIWHSRNGKRLKFDIFYYSDYFYNLVEIKYICIYGLKCIYQNENFLYTYIRYNKSQNKKINCILLLFKKKREFEG